MSLEEVLKDKGLRLTLARRSIFSALEKSPTPLTPKQLFDEIGNKKRHRVDLVSIYRNLELFEELGLVHEVFSGKYTLCELQHSGDHRHVHVVSICTDCGSVSEIKDHDEITCELSNGLKRQTQALSQVTSIVLRGVCGECL